MTGGLAFFDYGMLLYRQTFYHITIKQEEEAAAAVLKKLQKDRSVVTRRMTNINCKTLLALNFARPWLRLFAGPRPSAIDHGAALNAHAGAPKPTDREGRSSLGLEEGLR